MYKPPDQHPIKAELNKFNRKKKARRIAKKATRQARMSVCRIVLCAEYYSVFRYTIYDPARNLYPTEIYGFYHKFPLFGCMKMTLPLRTNGSSSLVFNA